MGGFDFTSLLAQYSPQIQGAGQPVGGGSVTDVASYGAPSPGAQAPRTLAADDPETPGGEKKGFDWKNLLIGGGGTLISGLLGGGAAAAGFATNYANAKHAENLKKREEEHQTQKAVADQAHKAWQDIQGADWSVLPPELSHLSGKAAELNQKYISAIAKDSPGGVTISPKEAQEIISISSVLRGAKEKVGAYQGAQQKQEAAVNAGAQPFASGLMSGTLEPPPGIEGMLDSGMSAEQAAQQTGRDRFQAGELARQDYDTPREGPYGPETPRDRLTRTTNEARAKQASLVQAATEADRLRRDSDRDRDADSRDKRFYAAQGSMNERFAQALGQREEHFNDRNQVPPGAGEKINLLAELRTQIKDVQGSYEKAVTKLGPLAGRLTMLDTDKLGGYGLNPDELDAIIKMRTLVKTETFKSAGQAVSAHEKKLAQSNLSLESDTLDMIAAKNKVLSQVVDRDIQRRVRSLPKAGQRQLQDMLAFDGVEVDGFGPPPGMPGDKSKDPLGILN